MSGFPCKNNVSYYVPHGFDYREVLVKCGRTDLDGERAICDRCRNDAATMAVIERQERNIAADNQWAHSAGYGDY